MRAPKTNIIGTFDSVSGETVVESQKGQHFRTMGRADAGGRVWLLPEETLYLLERGNLDVRCGEGAVVWSLQAAYAMLVGRGGVGLERYTVYAGLKRSGYVVQRGPAWDEEDGEGGDVVEPRGVETVGRKSVFAWMYRLLFERKPPTPLPLGPLVGPGLYRSYSELLELSRLEASIC